jgi:hypothetical protein
VDTNVRVGLGFQFLKNLKGLLVVFLHFRTRRHTGIGLWGQKHRPERQMWPIGPVSSKFLWKTFFLGFENLIYEILAII